MNHTMPFGKYRGWRISALPDSYIDWLRTVPQIRNVALRAAIDDEATRRAGKARPARIPTERRGVVLNFAAAAARLRARRARRPAHREGAREQA